MEQVLVGFPSSIHYSDIRLVLPEMYSLKFSVSTLIILFGLMAANVAAAPQGSPNMPSEEQHYCNLNQCLTSYSFGS